MDKYYAHIYVFGRDKGPFYGRFGEVPGVYFHESELNVYGLPPLGKSSAIKVVMLREKREESELRINWFTENNVEIGTRCRANHPKVKEQLKNNQNVAEKIINLLMRYSERGREELRLDEVLLDSEVPEKMQPFIKQIGIWQEFLKPFKNVNLIKCCPSISGDGFYRFFVRNDFFKLTIDRWAKEDNNLPSPDFWKHPLFAFDPQNEPPKVVEDRVYWELEDKRVAVILTHNASDEYLAEYYGYRASYNAFRRRVEEKNREDKEIREKMLTDAEEREKEELEYLKKALLF